MTTTSSLSNKLYSVYRRPLSVIYPPLPMRTPLVWAKLQPLQLGGVIVSHHNWGGVSCAWNTKKITQYYSPKSLFTTCTHDYDLSIKTTSNSTECNNRTMCCRKCSGSFTTFNQTNSVQILKIIVLLNSVKFSSLYFTPVI